MTVKKEKTCPEPGRRILVAMSGGVDSSVAAALLVKAGYEVTGMFAVNYEDAITTPPHANGAPLLRKEGTNKCWVPDYQDALRVAAHLGIPLMRWNFVKEYQKFVLDYMYKEYSAGRTPNPDILCNKFVKFGFWLNKAREMGFDKLATGHYAKIKRLKDYKIKLLQAKDSNKDQTYFLHQLTQEQLQHVLFPIGEYTKPEVRKLAEKFKLPTAKKEESMGICFIGEVPMRDFLKDKVKAKSGKIVNTAGEIVGEHTGLPFYTIGERVGVSLRGGQQPTKQSHTKQGIATPRSSVVRDDSTKPLFVINKDIKKNVLIIGFEDDPLLYKKEINVGQVNWIGQTPKLPLKCKVRLRHRQELQECLVISSLRRRSTSPQAGEVVIKFTKPQRAITPGQFAVFYLRGECLGGGVIS